MITTDKSQIEISHLRKLRNNANLTVREVAEAIGTNHQTVLYWEKVNKIGNTELLMPLAQVLGVTIEEVLGYPKQRNTATIGGQMGKIFEEASTLPRRQQQKIIDIVEPFIKQHSAS